RASPEILALARRVSEAQIDLQRVRRSRYGILARNLSNPNYSPKEFSTELVQVAKFLSRHLRESGPMALCPPEIEMAFMNITENKVQGAEKFAHILAEHSKQLAAMDRYERRALSRRKFAIRELDTARLQRAKSQLAGGGKGRGICVVL